MNLEPINSGLIVNTIVQRITESIINGELKPGDKLPTEMELVEKLGVARNSIREAQKMLIALGVLETRRGSGTFVASKISSLVFNPLLFSLIIDHGTSEDIYELRVMFESAVINIVMNKASQEDIDALEKSVQSMREKIGEAKKDSRDSLIEAIISEDVNFHNLLLKATHNPLIERIGQTIIQIYEPIITKTIRTTKDLKTSLEAHEMILNTIKLKEEQSTNKVVDKSLEEWKASLK